MAERVRNKDVQEKVLTYLRENPEIWLSLDQGIVNIAGLSANICMREKNLNQISVRAALKRIMNADKGRDQKDKPDELLRKSKISLQDKVSVLTSEKQLNVKYISATFLEGAVVYIIDEMVQKLPRGMDGVSVESHVSMIHIYSPKEIETVPGFVMRITQKLFSRGINILQLISCSNETILILNKDSCVKAYQILSLGQ